MNKTIKEMADDLGVNKQKVYRFIRSNNLAPVDFNLLNKQEQESQMNNSTLYYDLSVQSLALEQLYTDAHQTESEAPHDAHHTENETPHDIHQHVFLREQIEYLKDEIYSKNKQIDEKDKQIRRKDNQIESLHELLKNTQVLLRFWKGNPFLDSFYVNTLRNCVGAT